MIRWTFAFDEGHIGVDVRDEAEDKRIGECVDNDIALIYVPCNGKDAYVNLRMVKLIVREEVSDEPIPAPPAGAEIVSAPVVAAAPAA